MREPASAPAALTHFPDLARERVVIALRTALQERHLYQSVTVEIPGGIPLAGDDRPAVKPFVEMMRMLLNGPWNVEDPQDNSQPNARNSGPWRIRPPDVKLFCTPCDRIEAFNLVSAEEILSREPRRPGEHYRSGDMTVQVFVLSYQCQACKGPPEVFLVRRQGMKLTNTGRAPIEHVQVPADIPKIVKKFFSAAIVAHQSGQTLSGLFQLRTLIEQFARATTRSKAVNADEVMDEYMGTLPDDFKSRFPSVRELYGELSADLHTATGSAELFEKARVQIADHFEARRIFRLADRPAGHQTVEN